MNPKATEAMNLLRLAPGLTFSGVLEARRRQTIGDNRDTRVSGVVGTSLLRAFAVPPRHTAIRLAAGRAKQITVSCISSRRLTTPGA
jgi:hypothetical protein